MMKENVTGHMSLLLKYLQRERSVQSFALNASCNSSIDHFIKEGLI